MEFQGWAAPESNYFRVPNDWINLCAQIDSLAEMKVVQYILRHTWGFQEYGISKRITLDEFQNGRKRKDGTRMDLGVQMAVSSIREGLKRAVSHGFIEVTVDDSDKARIEKSYRLRMADRVSEPLNAQPYTNEVQQSGCADSAIRVRGFSNRTEKNTEERNCKKDTLSPSGDDVFSSPKGFFSGEDENEEKTDQFDVLAKKLYDGLAAHRKIMRKPSLSKWAKDFRSFAAESNLQQSEIEDVLDWYIENIGGEYIPRAYSVEGFCANFVRISDAKERASRPQAQNGFDRVIEKINRGEFRTRPKGKRLEKTL